MLSDGVDDPDVGMRPTSWKREFTRRNGTFLKNQEQNKHFKLSQM